MNSNIVRAWKDDFYRQSLSDEERAQLPENPVGELDLTEAELESVFAGQGNEHFSIGYDQHCNNSWYCPTHNYAHACIHHVTIYPDCYNSQYNDCYHTNYRTQCYYDKDKR